MYSLDISFGFYLFDWLIYLPDICLKYVCLFNFCEKKHNGMNLIELRVDENTPAVH